MDKQREADFQVYWKKKHHVGDEKMQREIFNHGHKAAQAAMQPEIDKLLHENNKFMWQVRDTCTRAEKAEQQLSAANQRIEELLDLVEVVERRNKQLEERIRVADAEEPVLWMFTVDGRYYTAKSKAHADSMLNHPDTHLYPDKPEDFPLSPLYLHAQIPAEVELKAKIAELEAIIKASQEQEPVEIECPEYHEQGMGRGLEDRCITDRYEAMRYGWDCAIEVMMFGGILPEPRYAAPVIKEQP